MANNKTGKQSKKAGRNSAFCKVYALSHRREVNKLRNLKKHISRHSDDTCASAARDRCKVILGVK